MTEELLAEVPKKKARRVKAHNPLEQMGISMDAHGERAPADLVREIESVAAAMERGELSARCRSNGIHEQDATIAHSVNRIIASLLSPLGAVSDAIAQMARGEIPPFVIDDYPGEHDLLKKNLNTSIATLYGVRQETRHLIGAVKNGTLATRGNDWDFSGNWRELISGVNDTFDAVLSPIAEASDALARLASCDLSVRMTGKYRGEHARIKRAFNVSVESLESAFDRVTRTVRDVVGIAVELASLNEEVGAGADEQVGVLNAAVEGLREINASSAKMAEGAKAAEVDVTVARGAMASIGALMGRVVTSVQEIHESAKSSLAIIENIDGISTQTNDIAQKASTEAEKIGASARGFAVVANEVRALAVGSKQAVNKLSTLANERTANAMTEKEKLRSLSEAVDDLSGIVIKLNFLSLNAAVEAAHVSEAGSGFEKLTGEVRGLAEQSKTAAEKTRTLLARSVTHAEEGRAVAHDLETKTSEITRAVETLAGVVSRIGDAVRTQVQGVASIDEKVARTTHVAGRTRANAERAASSTRVLRGKLDALAEEIGRFRIRTKEGEA